MAVQKQIYKDHEIILQEMGNASPILTINQFPVLFEQDAMERILSDYLPYQTHNDPIALAKDLIDVFSDIEMLLSTKTN